MPPADTTGTGPPWSSRGLASLVLRVGLGLVFLAFGMDKILHPTRWIMFVPAGVSQGIANSGLVSVEQVLRGQGWLEFSAGACMVAGFACRLVGGGATALLFAIVAIVGFGRVGVRDLGLLGAAVALALEGGGELSLDAWLERQGAARAPRAERVWLRRWLYLAWLAAVILVVVVLAPPERSSGFVSAAASTPTDGAERRFANLPIPPLPAYLLTDPLHVRIGRKLFHDTRLSKDGTVSCTSCHDPTKGGADGRKASVGVGGAIGELNAPTVFNAALNFRQFWDGRAETLEEQIAGPLENPREMGLSWEELLERLRQDPDYASLFRRAFADGITAANVKEAIADFERTLLTPDSPFDRYVRGDDAALSPEARRGWQLFKSLGCVSCHQGANVGGNIFQTMGKMEDYFAGRTVRTSDLGRFNVTGDPRDRYQFKVPSLRNVARTAPYFHDGSARTLQEAVAVMARYQLGATLNPEETKEIVAFLEALSGEIPEG